MLVEFGDFSFWFLSCYLFCSKLIQWLNMACPCVSWAWHKNSRMMGFQLMHCGLKQVNTKLQTLLDQFFIKKYFSREAFRAIMTYSNYSVTKHNTHFIAFWKLYFYFRIYFLIYCLFFCLKKYSLDSLAIATAAMEMLGGKEALASCRTDQIMADAAYVVLTRDSRARTGEFLIDEDVLIEVGVTDFEPYACVPGMSSWEDRVTGFRLGSGKDKRKERRDVYFEEFSWTMFTD